MFAIGLAVGGMIGGIAGAVVMSLCFVAKKSDEGMGMK